VRGSIAGRDGVGGRTGGDDVRTEAAGVGGAGITARPDPGADGMLMRGAPFAGGAGIAGLASAVAANAGGTVCRGGGGIDGGREAPAGSGGGGL
jgi:hypothetical protein